MIPRSVDWVMYPPLCELGLGRADGLSPMGAAQCCSFIMERRVQHQKKSKVSSTGEKATNQLPLMNQQPQNSPEVDTKCQNWKGKLKVDSFKELKQADQSEKKNNELGN